ncbi:MAG: hypothetical protein AAF702_42525 [Chloroflexota bacterium]
MISSSLQATTPIGLLIAGPLADQFGVQLIYILCGTLMLMNSFIYFFTPSILYFETQGKQRLDDRSVKRAQVSFELSLESTDASDQSVSLNR